MDFTTEAVCSPEKPEYRTKKHTLDPSAQEHITPECKGGELATDMAFGGRNPVNSIFPTSSGGFSGYVDNLEAEEERIKSYLVCIKDRSARRVTVSSQVGTAFPIAHLKAVCPRNQFAVSGGQKQRGQLRPDPPSGRLGVAVGKSFHDHRPQQHSRPDHVQRLRPLPEEGRGRLISARLRVNTP